MEEWFLQPNEGLKPQRSTPKCVQQVGLIQHLSLSWNGPEGHWSAMIPWCLWDITQECQLGSLAHPGSRPEPLFASPHGKPYCEELYHRDGDSVCKRH